MKTKLISLLFGILMSPIMSMQAELIYSTTINLEYDGDRTDTFIPGTPNSHFYDYLVYGLDRSRLPQLIPGYTYTLRIIDKDGNVYFEGYGTYFVGEEVYDEMDEYYYYTNTGNIQFAEYIAIGNIIADSPFTCGQEYIDEELLFNEMLTHCYYTSDWDHVPGDSFIIELYD